MFTTLIKGTVEFDISIQRKKLKGQRKIWKRTKKKLINLKNKSISIRNWNGRSNGRLDTVKKFVNLKYSWIKISERIKENQKMKYIEEKCIIENANSLIINSKPPVTKFLTSVQLNCD